MPFVINGSRKGGRIIAAALGLALLAAPTASADTGDKSKLKKAAANPDGCVVDHALGTPFAAWEDHASYALAPGGDFEDGAEGWTLEDGAAVAEGSQPHDVGAGVGTSSLSLPAGSSATSAPMCIDHTYPFFRFFTANAGDERASLKVEVLYLDRKGKVRAERSGTVDAAEAWAPSEALEIGVRFDPDADAGAAPVQFRFTPTGRAGDWRVDDLYIDPYAR